MKFIKLILLVILIFSAAENSDAADNKDKEILCSTFPVYQLTRNIVKDCKGIDVQILLPSEMGCPHDYSLTPDDMRKISRADILIINGLGLEEFMGTPIKKANKDLIVIDSSEGIENLLNYDDDDESHCNHECDHKNHHAKHEKHDKHHHHHHEGVNPHIFASPEMYSKMGSNIATELKKHFPAQAEKIAENTKAYIKRLSGMSEKFIALGKKLKNNRIITQHGVFDYLARDMGIIIADVVQAHAGQEPSAAEMIQIVRNIKKHKVGAIFTEPQYPDKVAQTLAREDRYQNSQPRPCSDRPCKSSFKLL